MARPPIHVRYLTHDAHNMLRTGWAGRLIWNLSQHPACVASRRCLTLLCRGQELKRVMKSERAGRLARDSAEILVGDRPGEFTVVTQEGSSIPVDVRDLTESSSGNKDPLLTVPASHSEPQHLAPMHEPTQQGPAAASAPAGLSAPEQAPALRLGGTEASEGSEPAPEAGTDQGSAAKKTTWLGSMMAAGTAALGLKGGAPADTGSTRSLQPAEKAAPAELAATPIAMNCCSACRTA